MNKLTSLGLAAAISATACGGRSELYNPTHHEKTTTTSSDTGGEGGAGGHGGTGGSGAGPTVGTILVRNAGSLDQIIGAETNARTSQFELSADVFEDHSISSIRLKTETALCDSAAIANPVQLYVPGKIDPVATGVNNNGYIDFTFSPPFILLKGQTEIFYTGTNTTDVCCHSTLDTYLEKPSDLSATGTIYGLPSTIDDQYSKADIHSTVETYSGQSDIEFLGPPSINIPVGTNDASCLDIKIWNCLPQNLNISNWSADLEVTNGDAAPDAKDLLNSGMPTTPNFTTFKLSQRNSDGTLGGSLFGPTELNTAGSDVNQEVTLAGNYTIPKGSTVDASVVFNVQNNQALTDNQVRCALSNMPAPDITGNIHTIVGADFPCITVDPSANPAVATIPKGSQNVDIACWDFTNACSQTNLKALTIQQFGPANYNDLNNARLFEGPNAVSDSETINTATGEVIFNNLSVNFPAWSVTTLCAHANVSTTAGLGDQLGLQITQSSDVILDPAVTVTGLPAQGPLFLIGQ